MPLARTQGTFVGCEAVRGVTVHRVTLDLSSCEQQPSLPERCGVTHGDIYHQFKCLSAEPANNTIEQFDDRTLPQDSRPDL